MTKVSDLTLGWSVERDAATGYAWFVRGSRRLTPYEFAGVSEARTVFRDLKRRLDTMDVTGHKADDFNWRAMDRAKIALQLSLRTHWRWEPSLLETGVVYG